MPRVLLVLIPALLAVAAAAALPASGEVQPFVRGSWQQIRAAHAGKPVVIHFWGVTCGPCRLEMPVWGELVKERTDLTLVTIHAERSPADPRTVARMLAQVGLDRTDNWMFSGSFLEPLRFEIDPGWQGELPMTLMIGRDGATKTVTGSAEPADVRAWLDAQTARPN